MPALRLQPFGKVAGGAEVIGEAEETAVIVEVSAAAEVPDKGLVVVVAVTGVHVTQMGPQSRPADCIGNLENPRTFVWIQQSVHGKTSLLQNLNQINETSTNST